MGVVGSLWLPWLGGVLAVGWPAIVPVGTAQAALGQRTIDTAEAVFARPGRQRLTVVVGPIWVLHTTTHTPAGAARTRSIGLDTVAPATG